MPRTRRSPLSTCKLALLTCALVIALSGAAFAQALNFDTSGNGKFTLCDSSGLCVNTDGSGHLEMALSVPLPAGGNLIGNVGLAPGANLIGSVSIANFPSPYPTGSPSGDLLVNGDNTASNTALSATGTVCPTNCLQLTLGNGEGVSQFFIQSLPATGATLVFEVTGNGSTWNATPFACLSAGVWTTQPSTGTTVGGHCRVDTAGFADVRVRVSVAGTGTFGVYASATSMGALLSQPLGSNTILQQDGNNNLKVVDQSQGYINTNQLKTSVYSIAGVALNMDGSGNAGVNIENTPAVTQSGTWNVGLSAGTNNVGSVGVNIPNNTGTGSNYVLAYPDKTVWTGALTSGTTVELIAGVANETIYIFWAGAEGTGSQTVATMNLEWGSGSTCGTGTVTLFPQAVSFAATSGNVSGLYAGAGSSSVPLIFPAAIPLQIPSGSTPINVCIVPGGTTVVAKGGALYTIH